MSRRHDYLLTALPTLDELGAPPPLAPAELLGRIAAPDARALVAAVALADDLALREAWKAGGGPLPRCAVLTAEQVRGEAPVPLRGGEALPAGRPAAGADEELWVGYLLACLETARRHGSALLRRWAASEVSVRNALAAQRGRALGVDGERWALPLDAGEDVEADARRAAAAWSAAPDPLAGLRALLRWRWAWIEGEEPWFGFGDDELTAYALRLVLMHRWARSQGGGEGWKAT